MTHKDKGRFARKHPPGTTAAPEVCRAVRDKMTDGSITCAAAHAIAVQFKCAPRDIGIAIDLQEAQLRKCQLGLFGHGPARKAVQPAETVPSQLESEIERALVDGRLSCAEAWRIADAAGLRRAVVAEACEKLGIKISQCQLGAF